MGMFDTTGRCVATVALVAFLVIGSSLSPAALAGDDAEQESGTGMAVAEDPNKLVVAASSGTVLEWADRGANQTHVVVEGVPASTAGYTLADPTGHRLFVNQSSRSDGVVEFWYIPLVPGVYTVTLDADGFDETITRFETASVLGQGWIQTSLSTVVGWLAPLGELLHPVLGTASASHGGSSCGGTYQGGASCPSAGADCRGLGTWHRVGDEKLWTPHVIASSPYKGSAEASQASTSSKTYIVLNNGWKSQTTTGHAIDANGGHTNGFYELAKWGLYQFYHSGCTTATPTDRYTAKVMEWTGWQITKKLTGASTWSGSDDTTSFKHKGYRSVTTQITYEEGDGCMDTTIGPRGVKEASNKEVGYGGGTVRIGSKGLTVAEFGIELGKESDKLYTYEFDQDNRWRFDELAGEGSALAFKYISSDDFVCD